MILFAFSTVFLLFRGIAYNSIPLVVFGCLSLLLYGLSFIFIINTLCENDKCLKFMKKIGLVLSYAGKDEKKEGTD